MDGNGNPLWTNDGVAICSVGDLQQAPQITEDGSGGATWHDRRNDPDLDIYVQRVGSFIYRLDMTQK